MNKPVSVYLDLVRATAAMVVFLGHAGLQRISGGLLYQFEDYGELAVDVFFVLSGFVICYVVSTRETSPSVYAINRLARVYSVALPAIIVSAVLDLASRDIAPATYAAFPAYLTDTTWHSYALALVFMNHHWFNWTQPGMDGPYWSLCFEVWYYIAFGFAVFLKGHRRTLVVVAVGLLAGPKICLLAPVWLVGVLCFRACQRVQLSPKQGFALAVASLAALLWWYPGAASSRHLYPFMQFEPTWSWIWNCRFDLIAGILFAVHIFGINSGYPLIQSALMKIARPVQFLAGASFTLYLLHYPLLHFVAAVSPWAVSDWRTRSLTFVAVPVLLLGWAEVTEKRKVAWRQVFTWLFAKAAFPRCRRSSSATTQPQALDIENGLVVASLPAPSDGTRGFGRGDRDFTR